MVDLLDRYLPAWPRVHLSVAYSCRRVSIPNFYLLYTGEQ